ncbi:MAG: phosphatidylglycerophosphatase A [Thiohalocapsa sp.]|jgi:phosphatidylglycerophosphatase A|uniref:phosphatidylglycerophosphatase A family protein n=1 Tax=Thiohalocapsa sp. TaxID=2497641 RepID=UPI0025FDA3D9|nr:phosphatidylglycerophosphatase A [Thiohalocapsa sp.]MCG6942565.1 phosphatidylglycerophosphatase A [Thiohalocapsa sp.]
MSSPAETTPPNFNAADAKHWLAFGFGAGLSPMAPGTVGTLVGVVLYLVLSMLPAALYTLVVVGLFAVGVWAVGTVAEQIGADDPPSIVWDEVVGFLVAMMAAPAGIMWIITGFLLFRAFDIVKPWPIASFESRFKGSLGIMLDDVMAGAYTWLVLHVIWMMVDASLRGAGAH